MQTPTATRQKAAYLILTSASIHAGMAGQYQAMKTIDTCIRKVADDMTLPTLQESIELVSMLVWPKYDTF